MSNAAKHRKKAAEFEQLKQIDRAIASYVRAIEESEAAGEDVDVALLNKVGDLALRQGRVPDAVTYYERAVEHYATAGLFNNAIALCNKILRNAPGRSNVYFTLGRICQRKGLRGDATRNFLEYAARMQQEGRVEEAMRALGEVADLMPELTEVRRLVDEHAERAGVTLPRRRTPQAVPAVAAPEAPRFPGDKSSNLVFLDIDYGAASARLTPPLAQTAAAAKKDLPSAAQVRAPTPVSSVPLPFLTLDAPPARVAPVGTESVAMAADPKRSLDPERRMSSDSSPLSADDVDFVIAPIEPESTFLELPMLDLVDNESQLDSEPLVLSWDIEQPSLREPELMGFPLEELHTDLLVQDAAFGMELVAFDLVDDLGDEATNEATNEVLGFSEGSAVEELVPSEAALPDNSLAVPHDLEQDRGVGDLTDEELDERNAAGIEQSIRSAIERMEAEFDGEEPCSATPVTSLEPLAGDAATPAPESGTELAAEAEIQATIRDERALTTPHADADAQGEVGLDTAVSLTMVAHPWFRPLSTPAPMLAIDAAIAAGAERALRSAEADPVAVRRRPPYRLDPHDFILPGELPPLLVSDESVDEGIERANAPVSALAVDEAAHAPVRDVTEALVQAPETPDIELQGPPADLADAPVVAETLDQLAEAPIAEPLETSVEDALDERSAVSLTPSLPIAAVAAEANVVAASRRDELRTLVVERPQDWALRRRLAEALFEDGQRDAALAELEASLTGFVQCGEIAHAADISEILVGVSPERVSYHQKRVELAVRLKDEQRLRFAYLDLADTLVRKGEEARAQAVYVRVLEIDPLDDRARAALGSAAPPLPGPTAPEPPGEGFVNLADWLREDEAPVSTRMRMREPAVSGDEDADFASLLRHFKEGVSRSLGDEDFESRYDLGVAYKEMGLLDDAVAEFQKALRSRTHRLPAYEALGQCFVEQGRYQVAATVLSRALHEPGLNDEQRVGVLYLLAYSCEALQRWGDARSYFQRVYATDINFRDVAARLAALEHIAS